MTSIIARTVRPVHFQDFLAAKTSSAWSVLTFARLDACHYRRSAGGRLFLRSWRDACDDDIRAKLLKHAIA